MDEKQLKDLQEAYGEVMLELRARKKVRSLLGAGREMIGTIRQGLKADGYSLSISQLCRWFGVPRRTVYYRPSRKPLAIQERFEKPMT